jgi:hypothetical protein
MTYIDANSDLLDDGNPINVGSNPNLTPIAQTIPSKTIDISDDWVHCNLCNSKVFIRYLDSHLKVHIHQHESKTGETKNKTSTALVRVADAALTSTAPIHSWVQPERKEPQLQSLETYKFRELENVCAAGSVSKTGRYSDFTVIFWGEEKIVVQNSNHYSSYGSHTSWTTKDWERLQIHVVYDSVEDYYTVSCKLLRRGSYSSWDNDDCIPDRICYQHELMTEIKRALLFFKVDPKSAYRKFRKLFRKPVSITYDNGKALVVQTDGCEELDKKLDNKPLSQPTNFHTQYGGSHERFTDI